MRMGSVMAVLATILVAGPGWAQDELMQAAQKQFQPIPELPPQLSGNPAIPAKLQLGKMLYFEPRISESHTVSCNTCHNIGLGGTSAVETSTGHLWQHGPRNAPTVLNSVFNEVLFWDGRPQDLQRRAHGPLTNLLEITSPAGSVAEVLKTIPGYVEAFKAAFPSEPDPVTMPNAQKAMAVFLATLITPNAPFDQYLRGNAAALSSEQQEGLRLFISKGCTICHNGINIGGGMYAPFGVVEQPGADLVPPGDAGRFAVTHSVNDQYVYKVPTLRNVALTAPYFHTGRPDELHQTVAVMGAIQLGVKLSDEEVTKITAFLKSLTGELPKVVYPTLPPTQPH